jgi:diacylglycerol kinase (ATP)
MSNTATGLKRWINAFHYTAKGIHAAWRNEEAFRQEIIGVLLTIPIAVWLARSYLEFALLVGSGLLVVIVELLNSAIEAVVDRIGAEKHELSGRAKDMGSAAVFVALILTAMVWLGVLIDRLMSGG